MDIDDSDNYVLDVPITLLSNISYGLLILLIGVFTLTGANFLGTIESEEAKLMGAIVWMFSIVSLVRMLHVPNLEYKPRSPTSK